MTTTCLDCLISTGVGEMYGTMGLPSLDEAPRGRGNHRLAKTLSTGGDADTDETFGFIYSGFRALGLEVHSLERYRGFLEEHSSHRLFEWAGEERDEQLPAELRRGDRTKLLKYRPPRKGDGYVSRRLVFECAKCEDAFESDTPDWVKPFAPTQLGADQIRLFRKRAAQPAECCIHEAEPFEILYMDLDEWLSEHQGHKPVMRLEEDDGA